MTVLRAMATKQTFSPRLTRAAAKRALAAEAASSQPLLKKQLVSSNAVSSRPGNAGLSEIKSTRSVKKGKDAQAQRTVVGVSTVKVSSTGTAMEEDPQMVIYHYLRSMEAQKKRRPLVGYMEKVQPNLTADMRAYLINWVVHVAEAYKLEPDTLFLTVSCIDRFLSYNVLEVQGLLLLGASALIIASKYEEIESLTVKDICRITPRAFKKQEILEMEKVVLESLKYEIGNPTAVTFLTRFINDGEENGKDSDSEVEFLAQYLAELSLMDYACIKFLPSVVAASAIFLARFTVFPTTPPWTNEMERKTGYKASDLKKCVYVLLELQLKRRCSSLQAIREKYNKIEFKQVSTLRPKEKLLNFFFMFEEMLEERIFSRQ